MPGDPYQSAAAGTICRGDAPFRIEPRTTRMDQLHPSPTFAPFPEAAPIVGRLVRDGYDFVAGDAMGRLVAAAGGADWDGYARSWDDLRPDRFMADGGTYRKRRFACFAVSASGLAPKPPQPHVQTRENNPLNGGVARVFEPVLPEVAFHPTNRAVMAACLHVFNAATPAARRPNAWHAEMHQFRIEARPGESGQPTPEGLHRDGVDWVLVMMVRRENVSDGVSMIADAERRPVKAETLTAPLDSSLVDDRRVFHGVSPIAAIDPSRPAFRDVLVVTFRAEDGESAPTGEA